MSSWVDAAYGMQVESLGEAHRHCARVGRDSGSSFASTFWMFPLPQRRALRAVYAFCRLADDIADHPAVAGDRGRLLERWHGELDRVYQGRSQHPVGLALADAVERYRLPESVFRELLEGIAWDLQGGSPRTYDELTRYCHQVASTVGSLVVRIRGFHNARSLVYADVLGIAVQLTNVLRDVGDDARSGRIYLAREDLDRMGVSEESLACHTPSAPLRELLAVYAERARILYERAEALLPPEDRRALRPAEAMGRIYRALLEDLHRRRFPCLEEPLRLSRRKRIAIAASVWLGLGGSA